LSRRTEAAKHLAAAEDLLAKLYRLYEVGHTDGVRLGMSG